MVGNANQAMRAAEVAQSSILKNAPTEAMLGLLRSFSI
jgi:hypothetical protein